MEGVDGEEKKIGVALRTDSITGYELLTIPLDRPLTISASICIPDKRPGSVGDSPQATTSTCQFPNLYRGRSHLLDHLSKERRHIPALRYHLRRVRKCPMSTWCHEEKETGSKAKHRSPLSTASYPPASPHLPSFHSSPRSRPTRRLRTCPRHLPEAS